jgi:hypothetical protein
MRQKIYIISCGKSIKIGISKDSKRRLRDMQVSNPSLLCIEFETLFCDNAIDIESIIHSTLSTDSQSGEWFSTDINFAIKVTSEVFELLAINPSIDSFNDVNEDDQLIKLLSYISMPSMKYGMYKISDMIDDINNYRVDSNKSAKQLAQFFVLESTKRAMIASCLNRKVPIDMVKLSKRGKLGGTWVDSNIFEIFLKWASGLNIIGISDLSKAIEKAR